MNNKSKIKRLAAVILPLFLIGGVILPLNTFAQSYSVEFSGWLQPWGDPHGSYMEKSIYLPSSGRYEVWAYVGANSGAGQLYEEIKVLVDGKYIGQTNDPNIGDDWTNESLGEHDFNAGNRKVRLEHRWNYSEVGDQSVHPQKVTFALVSVWECNPGQTQTEACGNCGTQTKTCQSNHTWGSWGTCQGEGECSSGDTQTQSCGAGGTQTRTCQSGCSWGSWGTCQGENNPPVANAGPDKEVHEGQSVTINGSGSDPDGDPITYYWTCTGAYLSSRYIAQPAFSAPQVSYAYYYTCTLKVTDDKGLSDTDSMMVRVLNQSVPTADIKANYSDGPITIDYNTSAVLTWTSSNTNSCYASGNWSGTKSTTGSDTTGNLVSSRTYSIICSGPGGSANDSVVVNVATVPAASNLIVSKMARNLSRGTNWSNSVSADPGEMVSFLIKIEVTGPSIENLVVKDILPDKIIYQGNLKIDSVLSSGDIISGLNVGSLSPGQIRTITFDARLAGADQFGFGTTQLSNSASVYTDSVSGSDTVVITVTKTAVAGAATTVSTGLTNNIFLDSFFLPLVITCIIIWFFRSHIIHFGEWLDLRKERYQKYHVKKLLQLKLAQIRAKEFFRKKVIQRF